MKVLKGEGSIESRESWRVPLRDWCKVSQSILSSSLFGAKDKYALSGKKEVKGWTGK